MSTKLTKSKIEKPDEQQEFARHEEILAILWEKHLATKKQLKQRFSKLPDLKKLLQSDLVYNILSFFDIFDLANFKKISKLFNQTVNLIFSNMKTVDVSNVSCNKLARLYSKEGILKFIDTFTKLENLSLYNEEASLPMGWLDDNLLMDVLQKAKFKNTLKTLCLRKCVSPTLHQSFAEIGKRFTSLTRLDLATPTFNNVEQCSKSITEMISRIGHSLKSLNLNGTEDVNDEVILAIIKHCTQLEELEISGCMSITTSGYQLLTALTRLKVLNINLCYSSFPFTTSITQLDDIALSQIPKCLTDLTRLDIGQGSYTKKSINMFATHCTKLQHLCIEFDGDLTKDVISALTRNCTHLTNLKTVITDPVNIPTSIKRLPLLKSIDIKSPCSIKLLGDISKHCKQLESLSLILDSKEQKMEKTDIEELPLTKLELFLNNPLNCMNLFKRLQSLQELYLKYETISLSLCKEIVIYLPKLRILELGKTFDKELQILSKGLEMLEILSFYGDSKSVTDKGLEFIANAEWNLKKFCIVELGGITDNGLCTLLKRLPELYSLDVTLCKNISEKILDVLSKHCKKLRFLNVSGTKCSQSAATLILPHVGVL